MSEPFIAEVRIFAGNFAPRGWAFCDGQLLPIAQNTALFSLIGTTYGGDGRTTTALPNLQGRAPMHPGRGPGLTARQLGQRTGVETVSLSQAQIPSHTHTLRGNSQRGGTGSPSQAVLDNSSMPAYGSATNLTSMNSNTVARTGGGQDHLNMQPFLSINFIISLQGLYPSRD